MRFTGLILLTVILKLVSSEQGSVSFIDKNGANFHGIITIPIQDNIQGGWNMMVEFQKPVRISHVWGAVMISHTDKVYTFGNRNWNPNLPGGSDLVISFLASRYSYSHDPKSSVTLERKHSQSCASVTSPKGYYTKKAEVDIFENWPGALKANVSITATSKVDQWEIHLKFSKEIKLLQVPKATFKRVENNYFILGKRPWARNTLAKGESLEIKFIAYFDGPALPCITATFAWKGDLGNPVTTPMSTIQPSTEELTTVQPPTEELTTVQPLTDKPTIPQSSTKEATIVPHSSFQPTTSLHIVTQNCSSVEVNGSTGDQTTTIILRDDWPKGFKATIYTTVTENITNGWNIILSFSTNVTGLQVWRAIPNTRIRSGTRFVLKNWPWNRNLVNGTKLEVSFLAFKTTSLPNMCAQFVWQKNPISKATSLPTVIRSTSEPTSTSFKPLTDKSSTYAPSTEKPTTDQSSTKEATIVPHSSFQPTTSVHIVTQNCSSVEANGSTGDQATTIIFRDDWPDGFKATIYTTVTENITNGWNIILSFSTNVTGLQVWRAIPNTRRGTRFVLKNWPWNRNLVNGTKLEVSFLAFKTTSLPHMCAQFVRQKNPVSKATPLPTVIPSTLEPTSTTFKPSTDKSSTYPPSTEKPTTVQSSSEEATTVQHSSFQPTTSVQFVTQNCSSVEENGSTGDQTTTIILRDDWPEGFKATIYMVVTENITNGWNIILSFSTNVTGLQVWRAIPNNRSGTRFVLKNWSWNRNLVNGTRLEVSFLAFKTTSLPNMCAQFVWQKNPISKTTSLPTHITYTSEQSSTPTSYVSTVKESTAASSTISSIFSTTPLLTKPATTARLQTTRPISTTASSGTTQTVPNKNPYDYNEVLKKSISFYEAQRSGYLPATNRIPWRGDSATNDKGENGVDLVGGWYDAGDHVKFGFPMAFSTTLLTWGLLEYRDAYENADQLQNMLSSIKWPLDYFLKAHAKPDILYGQVGDAYLDHSYWGRPEFMTMKRPAYKITKTAPGSDLAAETAAAMAAGSLAFRSTLPTYADNLLKHAKELFSFADNYRGLYTQSISNARQFYNSVSYKDELVWGALWLYKATNDQSYLTKAENYFKDFGLSDPGWAFSWDEKIGGLQLILYQLTKKQVYQDAVKRTLNTWLPGGGITYTPKGLAWRLKWGPNRYAANTAFLALVAADNGLKSKAYRDFGKKQTHYMLGDSGRSYVVGFGKNPPVNPHHRASSCAVTTRSCRINDPTPNPNILYGALVGGPDKDDKYKDQRQDYIMNEVATDYNAGFQSAVAALKSLEMKK